MKGALIGLFLGGILLVLQLYKNVININKESIDVHVHDTYFILSYKSVIIFLLLYLGTFFILGGLIGFHFKSKMFLVSTITILLIDVYYFIKFYKAIKKN